MHVYNAPSANFWGFVLPNLCFIYALTNLFDVSASASSRHRLGNIAIPIVRFIRKPASVLLGQNQGWALEAGLFLFEKSFRKATG